MKSNQAKQTVYVNTFTDGMLDPAQPMLGPVKDGGHIIANTTPGCWGPMITPRLKGGHEVTQPVYVEGAEVGDAIAIRIRSIRVTSIATASGNDETVEGRFLGDPFVAAKCPQCGTLHPETRVEESVPGRFDVSAAGRRQLPSSSPTDTPWPSMMKSKWGSLFIRRRLKRSPKTAAPIWPHRKTLSKIPSWPLLPTIYRE